MIAALPIACLAQTPVVTEHYDALIVVDSGDEWQRQHVLFIRGDKVIAERCADGEWLWTVRDGKPAACWDDYGTASRIVTCDEVVCVRGERVRDDANVPWWGAARNMRELRAPAKVK